MAKSTATGTTMAIIVFVDTPLGAASGADEAVLKAVVVGVDVTRTVAGVASDVGTSDCPPIAAVMDCEIGIAKITGLPFIIVVATPKLDGTGIGPDCIEFAKTNDDADTPCWSPISSVVEDGYDDSRDLRDDDSADCQSRSCDACMWVINVQRGLETGKATSASDGWRVKSGRIGERLSWNVAETRNTQSALCSES